MVDPSHIGMNGNSEQYQDDQSASDKAQQANKDMPSGKDRDSEDEK